MKPTERTLRALTMCPLAAIALIASIASARGRAYEQSAPADVRDAVLAEEDARANDPSALVAALASVDPDLRARAARAIGRLERPALASRVAPLLTDRAPAVRAAAAFALGQSAQGIAEGDPDDRVDAIAAMVRGGLDQERDHDVKAARFESIGRLPYRTAGQVHAAELTLTAALTTRLPGARAGEGSDISSLGALRGIETIARVHAKRSPLSPPTLTAVRTIVTRRDAQRSPAPHRRLAASILASANALDAPTLRAVETDPDEQVRRIAALAASTAADAGEGLDRAKTLLADRSPMVRYEALRSYGRLRGRAASPTAGAGRQTPVTGTPDESCAPIFGVVGDASAHVSLLAVDLLGECTGSDAVRRSLLQLASTRSTSRQAESGQSPDGFGFVKRAGWRVAAHAAVALAKAAPDRSAAVITDFANDSVWFVRMYAARAAAEASDAAALERLAHDARDNVREAAITGLLRVKGHDADPVFIEALERPDYELVRTAALALKGSPNAKNALPALHAALARITTERRDTSRDPRVAIVERIGELGDRSAADSLRPYLKDFDPSVAGAAAKAMTSWGEAVSAAPTPQAGPPAPTAADIASMPRRARITVADRGAMVIALYPQEAPATVHRFVTLATRGYYTNLTLHRVVPNFVAQGGSPGANEYVGDGPFMRDEVGRRSHLRGALGISTRGRDTGDAQIFFDLIDNRRLDFAYTVFADVVEGLDVMDAILEGDVIAGIEFLN